jgi:hypothetical protein
VPLPASPLPLPSLPSLLLAAKDCAPASLPASPLPLPSLLLLLAAKDCAPPWVADAPWVADEDAVADAHASPSELLLALELA